MKTLVLPALVASWLAFGAQAATTTTVVDIPAATGGTQRYLHIRPDAPIATLVHVPGGTGTLGIQADGSANTQTGQCSPFLRNRTAVPDAGIAIAMVDATSNGLVYNYEDILEVVRHVRARDNVPVWVIGGSASTGTIDFLARNLPGDVGAVFYSPARPSSATSSIRRPTLVVFHSGDPDQFGTLYFNALTSAAVRERVVLTGGTNAGCGFHLFNGVEAEFASTVTSFVTRHNAATRAASPNYQGLWWRSPAESESGWGVNITHQANTLFGTWFTYDADGRGMWLVMPNGAKGSGETYSGALYRTTGPAFSAAPFNPAQVVATEMGSATFAFAGANEGTFTYTVNGITQSKPITKQAYAAMPECTAGGAHGASPNYQALWWGGEAESGWGVNVTHQGDIVFATWFTYDTDGRGMWLVMPNGARTGPGAYSGALYRTTGPAFSAQPWVGTVAATEMGRASFLFSDAEHGTFTYTVGSVTQSKPIVRQVYASPATVCR
jgi:hypothetical protein